MLVSINKTYTGQINAGTLRPGKPEDPDWEENAPDDSWNQAIFRNGYVVIRFHPPVCPRLESYH